MARLRLTQLRGETCHLHQSCALLTFVNSRSETLVRGYCMVRRCETHAWKRQRQDHYCSRVRSPQHKNGRTQLTICNNVRPYLSVTQSLCIDALVDCKSKVRPVLPEWHALKKIGEEKGNGPCRGDDNQSPNRNQKDVASENSGAR